MQLAIRLPRPLIWASAAVATVIIFKKLLKSRTREPKIRELNWKKDTVYLYQFGRPQKMASLSPFCVKLEMFLRLNNIPYENCFISKSRSKYGLVPFIELNGVHYADSQLIMEKLKEQFQIKPLADPQQVAYSRALERMAENHSFPVFIKYKVLDSLPEFVSAVLESLNQKKLLPFTGLLGKLLFKPRVENRVFSMLGPYSNEEFHMLLRKDLETFRDALGENKFFMGDEASSVDCTIFGQLATVFYLQYPTEVQRLLREEFPTLVEFQERIKYSFFSAEF